MSKQTSSLDRAAIFKSKVKEVKGDSYTVLGDYIGSTTKILIKHEVCNYEWETTPNTLFATKNGCPKCAGNARLTTRDYINEVYNRTGNDYKVLGEYVNARTKVQMLHTSCGHTFESIPYSFLGQNARCPKCYGKTKRTEDAFKLEVQSQVGSEYLFLDKYVNNQTKLRCKHLLCGYVWNISPASFLNKHTRCPKCAGNAPLTNTEFLVQCADLHGDDYEFLEPYAGYLKTIKCKHSCGNIWKISPSNFLRGRECPECFNVSKGERYIKGLLEYLEVPFEMQKTFDGCVHVRSLLFDFYIPDKNLAIEYDGEQHYAPVDFSGKGQDYADANYELTKIRDKIKDDYCVSNSINLLRLPYYMSNEEIRHTLETTLTS